jgi:adenylate cyclase class 2
VVRHQVLVLAFAGSNPAVPAKSIYFTGYPVNIYKFCAILRFMNDKEIEIQARISDVKKLESFLKLKAKFKGKKYQKDEYYSPPHRNFLAKKPVVEWLRLRESKLNSVTYKNWHYDKDGKSQFCDEYETDINDINQLRKIFKVLDIKPIIIVEKTRKIWDYKDYEVAIDSVTNLGNFVEIEYKGSDQSASPKSITDGMIKFLKQVGCKKIERNFVGYPFMLLYPEEQVFEEV